MNQDRDNQLPSAESDPLVSARYRAIATERTPQALDALVLEKAKASTTTGLSEFTAFWFRPLAFVATLALSLALVLELTSNQYLEPAVSPQPDAGRRAADPAIEAPRVTEDFRKSGDLPTGKNQSRFVPAPAKASAPAAAMADRDQADAAVSDENISADFAKMVEDNSNRMKEQTAVTETAIQSLQQTRPAEEVQAGRTAAFSASAVVSDIAIIPLRACDAQQLADPRKWWQCIAELEKAGRQEEAKAELDLFNDAYPEFKLPESLPSQ